MIIIKNGHIKPVVGEELENGCLLIGDDGKIAAIGADLAVPEGAQVIDAGGRLVTPGCVEAHCHVGLHNVGLRWEGADYNESVDPITPQMRAIDSIYPQDEMLRDGLQGGVTTVCTGPGSTNVVGGTFAVIKLAGIRVDKMAIKPSAAMKCAFGENPKNAYGNTAKKSPRTRMATAALLRELLFKASRYRQDKLDGKNPGFDMKLEAMLPVLEREIPLKAHAHRADDIFTAIRIAKEFNLRLTLDHCTDGALIADELAQEGYPVLAGPAFTNKSKPELMSKSFATPVALYRAGVSFSIITDAPVTPIERLPLCAALAVQEGLPEEEGWRAITINPATHLGVADRVGSLEPGKDADVVIWTADPMNRVGAVAWTTIVDGKVVWQAQ